MIINMGRKIIHPAGDINELAVSKALTHFLNRAMDISKMRFYFFNGFSIQCNHQVQYTMCGRMLRAYIDDKITFCLPISSNIDFE